MLRAPNPATVTSAAAHDGFAQTAGALTGKTLPLGGTWAGAGDADDFNVSGAGLVTRTAVSDTTGVADVVGGRAAIAGTTTYTNVYVQVSQSYTAVSSTAWGVFARYTDQNNWLCGGAQIGSANSFLYIAKMVAGVFTLLASRVGAGYAFQAPTITKTFRLGVNSRGQVFLWIWTPGGTSPPLLTTQHADLATGGTLATGKIGFFDHHDSSSACTRTYNDFLASIPTFNATLYPNQSIELRTDGIFREDTAGTSYARVESMVGCNPRLPPSGLENRKVELYIKASRGDFDQIPDAGIDDVSAQAFYRPAWLLTPGA